MLVHFVRRRRDLPFHWMFWMFGAFIILCGTTHLLEVVVTYEPIYRFSGAVKAATALVSLATAAALIPVLPQALALRSPEELAREVAAREQAEAALLRINAELERRVAERTAELERANAALHDEVERRTRAQAELGEQHEWLRVTLTSIGDAVIATDAAGSVTFLNPVAETLTGWPLAEARGRSLGEIFPTVHELTREPVANPVDRVLREGTVVGLGNHTLLVARDGTERAIDDSAAPICGADGALVGVVLVFRDVTEVRRAAQTRALLAAIVESSEDAIVSKDLNGAITSWNRGAERLFGYTAEEVLGRPVTLLAAPGRENDMPHILERIRRGERVETYETARRARDGRILDVSLTVSPIRDAHGHVVGASKVARDITARKRLQEALRAGEEQLRLITDAVPALISYVDTQGRYLRVNRAYETWFGLSSSDLLGKPMREALGESAWAIIGAYMEQALAGQAVSYEREVPYRLGGTRWIHATYTPHLDGGRVLGVVVLVLDVTERKRMEEELRRRADALAEADRRKDEFLATLAHELRNPLAPLRNGLQILRLNGDDRGAVEEVRAMMERQLAQMVHLVDDLLDLARISRGRLELRRERVDLTEAVRAAVESSRPVIEAGGHALTVDLPPAPLYLDADVTRLAQVFANLLNNAARYTPPGGQVRLMAGTAGGQAFVSVRDTGQGIPADMLSRVFDPFTQTDRSLERAQGGLGIGLTLVKRLVEMHGGTVEARSAGPGRGSEFVVRLPLVAPPDARPAEPEPAPVRAPRRRVLVVDDNRDAARSLALLLGLMGHEVHTAHDGLEGVAAAEEYRPELILMDVGMPKLNGFDAARRIREQPWGRGPVIVALTGWGQEEDRRRSQEAGCDGHLVKPVDPDDLERLLAGLKSGDA